MPSALAGIRYTRTDEPSRVWLRHFTASGQCHDTTGEILQGANPKPAKSYHEKKINRELTNTLSWLYGHAPRYREDAAIGIRVVSEEMSTMLGFGVAVDSRRRRMEKPIPTPTGIGICRVDKKKNEIPRI